MAESYEDGVSVCSVSNNGDEAWPNSDGDAVDRAAPGFLRGRMSKRFVS